MSDYFPQEVILQILHKLPIKSLVCCTCVCKSWHSLIKNPSFISTHLTLTISSYTTTNTHLLLFRICSEKTEQYSLRSEKTERYSLHFDNQQLAPYMLLDFPFKTWKWNPYLHVIGSFNGIICLVDDLFLYNYTFVLWNPLIKKLLTLPRPNVTFSSHGPYEASIGFGFDSKTNDYKILRLVQVLGNEDEEEMKEKKEAIIEVELYSLNNNSWKTITSCAPKYEFKEHDMQVFVNGVVHWLAFERTRDGGFRNLVLGFDMGDEVFHEIKLPESLVAVTPLTMSARKYGDSLIAVIKRDYSDPAQCHIWVMKEYGVVGSWTKLLSLGEERGAFPRVLPRVLGFRRSGEVVLQMSGGCIVSFDPQNLGVKHCGLREQGGYCFVDGYVESLVLLDNANAVSDANAVIEDGSDDSVGASDAIDDSNDASNDTSDGARDASDALSG